MSSGRLCPTGIELTEEEAFSLLALCMTSPQRLDATSEKALRKLAEFCKSRAPGSSNYITQAVEKLEEAG